MSLRSKISKLYLAGKQKRTREKQERKKKPQGKRVAILLMSPHPLGEGCLDLVLDTTSGKKLIGIKILK
jgi:hypothetical protein